jgi:hypothetical protein
LRTWCIPERNVFIEHYFASKSFAAVLEANAYPDKKVPNKTTIHLLVIFRAQEVSVGDKCSSTDETVGSAGFKQFSSATTTGCGGKG